MIDLFTLITVFIAGLLAGVFFFGGLFWTVGRGLSAKRPAFWFFGSWLVRMVVVLGVLYLVSAGRWERMVVCAGGFFMARMAMIRFTHTPATPNGSK